MRLIYETVRWEAAESGVSDDDRMAEVRKRMLAEARETVDDSPLGWNKI